MYMHSGTTKQIRVSYVFCMAIIIISVVLHFATWSSPEKWRLTAVAEQLTGGVRLSVLGFDLILSNC